MNAWNEACGGAPPNTLLFPPGTYMAFPHIKLTGPCKGPIEIKATGATIKAPSDLTLFKKDTWIYISFVDGLTMTGGTFDGQGQQSWRTKNCNNDKAACTKPVNLRLRHVSHSLIKDVTSIHSKRFHIAMMGCDNTTLDHITINAPGDSVNTDGVHTSKLNGLKILNSDIKTGDDCISFGEGSKNIHVEKVTCGPGHGFSIGSLGNSPNEEPVQGIWVKNCTLARTDNGVRIKTWPGGYPGTVSDVHFEDIVVDKVANPIIIDQNYCPFRSCVQTSGPSKVKISDVSFRNIKGTSTTQISLKLNCSAEAPCINVELDNVNLVHTRGPPAKSRCFNIKPKIVGQVVPPACSA
ncbi:polygalacturonase-like isoform X2 [Rutidosis leptorrhynchoides]